MVSVQEQAHLKARADQVLVNEKRRLNHVGVAHALRNPDTASEVIDSAMIQIRLWQEKKLCSNDYINAWLALLNNPHQAADILEESSSYAIQMRQNTPFVSYIRRQFSHHEA